MISEVWHAPSSGQVSAVEVVVSTQARMNPADASANRDSPLTTQASASPYAEAVSSTKGPSVPGMRRRSNGRGLSSTRRYAQAMRSSAAVRYGSAPFAASAARRSSSVRSTRKPDRRGGSRIAAVGVGAGANREPSAANLSDRQATRPPTTTRMPTAATTMGQPPRRARRERPGPGDFPAGSVKGVLSSCRRSCRRIVSSHPRSARRPYPSQREDHTAPMSTPRITLPPAVDRSDTGPDIFERAGRALDAAGVRWCRLVTVTKATTTC